MSTEHLGAAAALATALAWSVAVILFRQSQAHFSSLGLNFFKNAVATILLVLSVAVTGVRYDWTTAELVALLLSGVFGLGVADTMHLAALRRLGAVGTAIVECAYAPLTGLSAYFLLGERVGRFDLLGGAFVILGVYLATTRTPGAGADPTPPAGRHRAVGLLLGLGAMLVMSVAVVAVKPIMERAPVWEVTLLRLVGGTAVLLVPLGFRAWSGARIARQGWRRAGVGAVLGTYVALLLFSLGYKYAPATVAAILNQTASAFTVLLAVFWLKEPLTRRRGWGALVSLVGAILVLVGR